MKTRRALFVSYGGGHVSMLIPVIRQLQASQPEIECVLLALTTGWGKAKAAGVAALGYKDFVHLMDWPAAEHWGRILHGGNSSPDVSDEESVAYLGANYVDLVEQHGEAGAAALYAAQGRYGFMPLHFMRRVMAQLEPDVVVATNSPRSEEAALRVAKELGIPSVGTVDLFGMDSDTYVLRACKPDWTCVIAASVRERLLVRGFPAEGVAVTGNPAFDGLFSPANRELAGKFRAERGWEWRQVILYIGAWESVSHPGTSVPAGRSFPIEIEDILRRYVDGHPRAALIVRYHPGDWFMYPRHAPQPNVHFSEPPAEHIHPLILASDVVVNTNSTVGLEAAIAGVPVISIENSPSVHHWFSLAELGVSHPSPTHLDLPQTLDEVLAHGRTSTAFRSDGQAACRVASIVMRAIKARL